MLDRVPRRAWGHQARLTASYILVTLAVVVLVEALVLGVQVPSLLNGAQRQAQADAAAKSYGQQLAQRYRDGVPPGTVLGEPGQPAQPGLARPAPDGTLVVPAITGPIHSHQAVTAAIAIAADGAVVASSARRGTRPDGRRPASSRTRRPRQSQQAPPRGPSNTAVCRRSTAACSGWAVRRGVVCEYPAASALGLVAYVYVQAPWSPRLINPFRAWSELVQLGETRSLLAGSFALLFAIVPVGVLFGLLASRRLVRRVRRRKRAAVADADGDYTVTLPASGRDEVGRLETNFTIMTRQLGSALAAERSGRPATRAPRSGPGSRGRSMT